MPHAVLLVIQTNAVLQNQNAIAAQTPDHRFSDLIAGVYCINARQMSNRSPERWLLALKLFPAG